MERALRSRDILAGARKAEQGVKQAAPTNYRRRCFVDVVSGDHSWEYRTDSPITRRNVRGSRLPRKICGQARAEASIQRAFQGTQSGSPPGSVLKTTPWRPPNSAPNG